MFSRLWAASLVCATTFPAAAVAEWPDTLVLADGTRLHGLILRNTLREVVLQHQFGELAIPKSQIQRIVDTPDLGLEFTEALRAGELPPWRVIANDLRLNDAIHSLVQIPAVEVQVGTFARVPYKSFRINHFAELNIYGDPQQPAAIELGLYGWRRSSTKLREALRSYLAGFLTTRQEVAALYSIPLSGGTAHSPTLAFEITPPTAQDAFGGWWVSAWHPRRLEDARLSASDYEALTRPASEVLKPSGRLPKAMWTPEEMARVRRGDARGEEEYLPRGFYRDRRGDFRPVFDIKP